MKTKLKSFFGLPTKVIFCKDCVISNQRPNSVVEMKNTGKKKPTINFGEDQQCSACKYNKEKRNINWELREKELFKLLDPYRSKNGQYDVLVPSSGGKDSSFTAHLLKYKYGMNPLAITWAPNIFTETGLGNFNSLSKIGGVDSLLYTPNGKLHSYLTKIAFKNLGHPFQPFVHGQKIIGPSFAKKFGIKLIVYGENQAEYGNPLNENKNPFMSQTFFSSTNPKQILIGGEKISNILKYSKFKYSDFSAYIPPHPKELKENNIKVTYLGYFEKWDPQECYYYSVENTGFQPAVERSSGTYSRYTEIDDKIVPFHFYMTFIKFGIGRATYDACQEIRNKKITRNEGVYLVDKFDGEFPEIYFDEFIKYLDINREDFYKIVNSFRSPHLWKYYKGKWILRHTVSKKGFDD
ncbi:N-acetyl sugar amidotransferase [Pelagibacteraceae bacterium]|nr:N-acetyl sugar amidotransferase [Pelagibacteraceae bacterium]